MGCDNGWYGSKSLRLIHKIWSRYTDFEHFIGIWEIIAFVNRVLLTRHQNDTTFDTLFTLFLLLAPLWVNAFLYMTLGRMVWFFAETRKLARLSAQRFGTLFVLLDVVSFIVQLIGAIPIANSKSSHSTQLMGLHIYMAGIGLQQFFILCFTSMVITLHRRLIQQERRGVLLDRLQNGPLRWRWLFYGIYFVLLMISVRSLPSLCPVDLPAHTHCVPDPHHFSSC